MRVRYRDWDREALRRRMRREQLLRLFRELLLRTSGDVATALAALEQIGNRHGLFGGGESFEEFRRRLEREGFLERTARGDLRAAPSVERAIRRDSLEHVFGGLRKGLAGEHRVAREGEGVERLPESRPWAFGDGLEALDANRTIHSALRRGLESLAIREDDLHVHETEARTSCATALCIDISHSMVLYGEDRITPAKKVALALAELILTKYPKDRLEVIAFGDEARLVPVREIARLDAGPYHTNTKEALEVAATALQRSRAANRQIVLITDGKPSCIRKGLRLHRNPFGLDPEIVQRTLDAAAACRKKRIPITTFMIARDPALVGFVGEMTRINRGRAYFASPDRLGRTILVDFVRNRRRLV